MFKKTDNKDLAQMIAANLIYESYHRLDKQLEQVVPLGTKFEMDSKFGQQERGKAISLTAGNPDMNKQLIMYMNELLKQVTKKYPYEPLIKKRKRQVIQAYNYAIGGHFSSWEQLIQSIMIKAIGNNALFESGNVIPSNLLRINENLKQIEHQEV